MKTIVLVVGLSGAGKSVVADLIARHGIPKLRLGDEARAETARRGLEVVTENVEATAVAARKEYGQDIFARRVMEKADALPEPVVCVEGARDLSEVRLFQKRARLFLVVVEAPLAVRFSRITSRRTAHDPPVDRAAFNIKERNNERLGIGEVVKYEGVQRFVVDNRGTEEALGRQVDRLVKEIKRLAQESKPQ